jgi:hypothetical protein
VNNKDEEVQIQVLLDPYKPYTLEFTGKSQIQPSDYCSRNEILSASGLPIIAHGDIQNREHPALEQRFSSDGDEKILAMVEATRGFVLLPFPVNESHEEGFIRVITLLQCPLSIIHHKCIIVICQSSIVN